MPVEISIIQHSHTHFPPEVSSIGKLTKNRNVEHTGLDSLASDQLFPEAKALLLFPRTQYAGLSIFLTPSAIG